ncbi:hypothetical protein [Agrobacterium sp. CG674]
MTAINTAVAGSLASILAINENITKLQEEAKAAREAALEPFLAALAESGEVSLIVVYGSTPGFNDGEPCTHSYDYFVNVEQARDEDCFDRGFDLDDLEELLTDEDGCITEESTKAAGHVYGAPSKEIKTAIGQLIVETVDEEEGTDYYVTYVLKDGKFEKNSGEYDCGY